jgi:hypothetical protein
VITFEQHNIEIRTPDGLETISATIGVNTGLAYRKMFGEIEGYTLIHIANKCYLVADLASDEETTQRWLEKAALLADWTANAETLLSETRKSGGSMRQLVLDVKGALWQAKRPM